MEPRKKPVDDSPDQEPGRQMLFQGLTGAVAERLVVQCGPSGPDDPQVARQQGVGVEPIE